jgi:hypothetical protein
VAVVGDAEVDRGVILGAAFGKVIEVAGVSLNRIRMRLLMQEVGVRIPSLPPLIDLIIYPGERVAQSVRSLLRSRVNLKRNSAPAWFPINPDHSLAFARSSSR